MGTNAIFIFTRNTPTLTCLQVRREQTLSSLVEQLLAAQKNAVEAKSKNPAPAYEACEICPKITLGKQSDSIEVHTSVNENNVLKALQLFVLFLSLTACFSDSMGGCFYLTYSLCLFLSVML